MEYVLDLILILFSSLCLGKLFSKMGLPSVIGQLMGGIILGPSMFHFMNSTSFISDFTEMGLKSHLIADSYYYTIIVTTS